MSGLFLVGLFALLFGAVGLRLLTPLLPAGRAVVLHPVEIALLIAGALGLAFHCAAMFFPDQTSALQIESAAEAVRDFKTPSKVMYAVPALLVIAALRRTQLAAVLVVVVSLIAVGVTMYDGSPLNVHLATIAVAVATISFTTAAFVLPGAT